MLFLFVLAILYIQVCFVWAYIVLYTSYEQCFHHHLLTITLLMARYKYHTLIKDIIWELHYTAEDVYDAIRKKWQKVSLATIYRTLEYMVGIKDLTIFSIDGSKTYYEKNKWPHAHLIDVDKDLIVDVTLATEKLQFPAWFRLNDSVINFFGSWEGNVPPETFSLLHTISIVDTHWQEKWSQLSTDERDAQNDDIPTMGHIKKIFREF